MEYTASVRTGADGHDVTVGVGGQDRSLTLPAREGSPGSAVSGGELLFLALATCCANDVFREAASRSLPVESVAVEVTGEFDAPGSRARDVTYRVSIVSPRPRTRCARSSRTSTRSPRCTARCATGRR